MNSKKNDIDRFLETYIPSPLDEDMEEDGARVLHRLKSERRNAPVVNSYSTDSANTSRLWLPLVAALAVVLVVFLGILAVRNTRPEIEVAEGILFATNGTRDGGLKVGERLDHQQVVRTSDAFAVLALQDGTRVEVRPQTALWFERAQDGERIHLNRGSVIVSAAKQRDGHLYVQTPDMTVAVVGTVFLVNAEEAGSRVAVFQGEVQVQQGKVSRTLLRGQQATSNGLMESRPLSEEISWSPHVEVHLALLQQASAVNESKRLEFEAASLRPLESRSDRVPVRVRCRGVDGELQPPPASLATRPVPLGRCVGDNVPLRSLIAAAYNVPERMVGGLINYITDGAREPYQIEAKAENPATATREDLRQMLRNLLIDRLKLVTHRETKELPGYVLSIAPGGIKFNETIGEEELPLMQLGSAFREQSQSARQMVPMVMKGRFRMPTFADTLSLNAPGNAPIIDRTDLTGLYDVNFTLNQVMNVQRSLTGAFVMGERDFDPPLGKALEQQLGLRLEAKQVPVDYLVVDHVEKPPLEQQGLGQQGKVEFEVATVKPSNLTGGLVLRSCRGIDTKLTPGDLRPGRQQTPLGRCVFQHAKLITLIADAYAEELRQFTSFPPFELVTGGPDWKTADSWDIEAKAADPSTVTERELYRMFQNLLVERFKLKFHRDSKEISGYELVVAKGGPKLTPAKDRNAPPSNHRDPSLPPGLESINTQNRSMYGLALSLTSIVGPVADKTQLPGTYDLVLTFARDFDMKQPMDKKGGPLPGAVVQPGAGPSLFKALEQQLGLSLEPAKLKFEFLVIDSAEKPSGN
jgi:uncharacterized protein (TIGR03435 family)